MGKSTRHRDMSAANAPTLCLWYFVLEAGNLKRHYNHYQNKKLHTGFGYREKIAAEMSASTITLSGGC